LGIAVEVLADPDFHPGTQGQLLLDYAGEVFENPGPPIQNFGTFRYVQELTILRLGTAAFFFADSDVSRNASRQLPLGDDF
jgi:hypothetical protein